VTRESAAAREGFARDRDVKGERGPIVDDPETLDVDVRI